MSSDPASQPPDDSEAAAVTPRQRSGRTAPRCRADERISDLVSRPEVTGGRSSSSYPRRAAGTGPEKPRDCFQSPREPFCTLNRFDILI